MQTSNGTFYGQTEIGYALGSFGHSNAHGTRMMAAGAPETLVRASPVELAMQLWMTGHAF